MKDYVPLSADACYFPDSLGDDEIVVGLANFALAGQRCPEVMRYKGKLYRFSCIEPLARNLIGRYHTALRYKLIAFSNRKDVYNLG